MKLRMEQQKMHFVLEMNNLTLRNSHVLKSLKITVKIDNSSQTVNIGKGLDIAINNLFLIWKNTVMKRVDIVRMLNAPLFLHWLEMVRYYTKVRTRFQLVTKLL